MIPESFQRNNGIFKNFRYADNRDGEPPEILRRRRFVARSKIHGFSDGDALSALREIVRSLYNQFIVIARIAADKAAVFIVD